MIKKNDKNKFQEIRGLGSPNLYSKHPLWFQKGAHPYVNPLQPQIPSDPRRSSQTRAPCTLHPAPCTLHPAPCTSPGSLEHCPGYRASPVSGHTFYTNYCRKSNISAPQTGPIMESRQGCSELLSMLLAGCLVPLTCKQASGTCVRAQS